MLNENQLAPPAHDVAESFEVEELEYRLETCWAACVDGCCGNCNGACGNDVACNSDLACVPINGSCSGGGGGE